MIKIKAEINEMENIQAIEKLIQKKHTYCHYDEFYQIFKEENQYYTLSENRTLPNSLSMASKPAPLIKIDAKIFNRT